HRIVSMGDAYIAGLRSAGRQWALCLVLFAFSLAAGLSFAAVTWTWLADALDNSLATKTLLADLDVNVFVDLFMHHAEGWRTLAVPPALAAVFFALLGVWLNGAVIAAVADDVGLSESLRRGLSLCPIYLRLWLLSASANGISLLVVWVIARWLIRWTAESPSEMIYY